MSQDLKKEKSSVARIARLSGMGMQLAGTVFVFALLGNWLDEKYPSNKKWFTIGLVLFATALSLYSILRQVNKMNEEDDQQKK